MLTGLQFFGSVAGNPTADGVKIPYADLGLDATEMSNAASDTIREAKFLLKLMNVLESTINGNGFEALGITIAKDLQSPANTLTATWLFNFSMRTVYDFAGKFIPLPVPTSANTSAGNPNLGVGDFSLTDIFANAAKVATTDSVSNAVVIPTSSLLVYGSPSHASLNLANDNRDYLFALVRGLINEATLRVTGTTQSAITLRTISNPVVFALDNTFFGASGLSDLKQADIPSKKIIVNHQHQINVEILPDVESSEVNVV